MAFLHADLQASAQLAAAISNVLDGHPTKVVLTALATAAADRITDAEPGERDGMFATFVKMTGGFISGFDRKKGGQH